MKAFFGKEDLLTSMNRYSPIGIFDSGAGGISVLKTAVRLLPKENFLYYGDTLHAPYGTKSKAQVLQLVRDVAEKLMNEDVKAIVIACNTATAAAAKELRDMYALPIIGMEPALKRASELREDGLVLVLATPGTLKSEKYAALYAKYGRHAVSLPCPGLMEFVERGEMDTPALHDYLSAAFRPFRRQRIDAVVLGCTHYVFLKKAVAKHFSEETAIIDGNEGTIHQLIRRLEALDLLNNQVENGRITLLTSGNDEAFGVLQKLFKENLEM